MSLFDVLYIFLWLFAQFPTDSPPMPVTSQDIVIQNASDLTELHQFDEYTRQISFSPDGGLIAIARQVVDEDYEIVVYQASTGQPISFITGEMELFTDMMWSPDSTRLATISGRSTVSAELQSVRTYTIALGSDPNFYAFGKSDGVVWNQNDYGPGPVTSSFTERTHVDVAWSPDSTLLAITFIDRLEIHAISEDELLFSHPLNSLSNVEWSPDGRYILTTSLQSRQIQLWGVP